MQQMKWNDPEFDLMRKNIFFMPGVVFIACLCAISEVYYSDYGTGISMIQLFHQMLSDKITIDMDQYNMLVILRRISAGNLILFVPVITGIPFVSLMVEERKSGFKRFYLFRQKSGRKYYVKHCIAGMEAGALLMLLGVCLFQLFVYLFDSFFIGYNIAAGSDIVSYVKFYTGVCLYGAASSVVSMIFCLFLKNIYFIICLPFILTYLYNIGITYLLSYFANSDSPFGQALEKAFSNMFSYSFLYILGRKSDFCQILIQTILLFAILFIMINRYDHYKTDKGE